MAGAHERILPLGEKVLAVLAEHDAGDAATTESDRLAAMTYAIGRMLGDITNPGEMAAYVRGLSLCSEQIAGHMLGRWHERSMQGKPN